MNEPDTLAATIYDSVKRANEVREFKRWHASSISECPRSHYFKRLGVTRLNEPGAGKMLRWQAGHLMEEVLRPHLQVAFPDMVSNVRLESDTWDLTGEYDNYSEKEATIIEDKSVHDFAIRYKRKDEQRFHLKEDQPYPNHELQNHCYAILLAEQGKPVKYITYVYITLDGRIATYKVPLKPELVQEVQDRLNILNHAWETQTPPECICKEGHPLWKSTMQYCDYQGKEGCCSLDLIGT